MWVVPHALGGGPRVALVKNGRIGFRDGGPGRDLGKRSEGLCGVIAADSIVISPDALVPPGTDVRSRALAAARVGPAS